MTWTPALPGDWLRSVRLAEHRALRVSAALRRGSSLPVIVQSNAGEFLTKLRGAAQGVAPLVAEIIVAELAIALGLPVPERAIIVLDDDLPSVDATDELADLLSASPGLTLEFGFLN